MLEVFIRTFPKNVNKVCDLAWEHKYGYMGFPPLDGSQISTIIVDVPKEEFIDFINELTESGISYYVQKVA